MKYLVLLTLLTGCATVGAISDTAVESAPSWLGALIGFLIDPTMVAVALGSLIGWLVGDDAALRVENKHLKEELGDTNATLGDAGVALADAVAAGWWPLVALGVVILFIPWAYRRGRKKALK